MRKINIALQTNIEFVRCITSSKGNDGICHIYAYDTALLHINILQSHKIVSRFIHVAPSVESIVSSSFLKTTQSLHQEKSDFLNQRGFLFLILSFLDIVYQYIYAALQLLLLHSKYNIMKEVVVNFIYWVVRKIISFFFLLKIKSKRFYLIMKGRIRQI